MAHNDSSFTLIPRKDVSSMRKKADLERLVKKVLEVPVDKAVRMTFKAAGHDLKQNLSRKSTWQHS